MVLYGPLMVDFAFNGTGALAEARALGLPPDTIGIRMPDLSDSGTKAIMPDAVILAISPNRSLLVKSHLWINPRTEVFDANGSAVVLAVEETAPDSRWIYTSHASFSPDGRFLLLLSNLHARLLRR